MMMKKTRILKKVAEIKENTIKQIQQILKINGIYIQKPVTGFDIVSPSSCSRILIESIKPNNLKP